MFLMTPLRSIRLIASMLVVLVVFPATQAQEAPLIGFDDYVNKALRDWEVPGLAIVIVKNDRVVFGKGYGVRKLGDPAPVNTRRDRRSVSANAVDSLRHYLNSAASTNFP